MLKIDRVRMTLPAGFEKRADRIGRLTAHALSRRNWSGNAALRSLRVPAVAVDPAWSDPRIAEHIAAAVHREACRELD